MHSDALLARAKEGDKLAQSKLVQLWYKRIYNFSYKFFFDHDLAMEVAQKTFISMHRNIGTLQELNRFKSWLYTIAVNYCREEVRKNKSKRSVSLNDLQPGESENSYSWEASKSRNENPERQLQQTELSDLLQKCLYQLSEEQREVAISLNFNPSYSFIITTSRCSSLNSSRQLSRNFCLLQFHCQSVKLSNKKYCLFRCFRSWLTLRLSG